MSEGFGGGQPGYAPLPPRYDPVPAPNPVGRGGTAPDPAPAPARRYLGPRSLTARLVIGVVVLVAVLVAAIGAGTYVELRAFLFDRLDQQVAQVVDNNHDYLEPCISEGLQSCPFNDVGGFQAPLTEWLVVLHANGARAYRPSATSHDVRPLELTSTQATAIVDTPNTARTLTTTDGASVRVAARAVRTPHEVLYVVSGLSTLDVRKTMHRLLVLELLIGGAALLLALLATAYGVRFSLRRLRRVTSTAQEVAAELSPTGAGLDRRVPVAEQGTEVGQLAESMNTLLAAVETQFAARLESEARLRQFLADASHELRTPLTSIRGYAELARMQRAASGAAVTDDVTNMARIEAEGTRMSRLVEDLLMLARGDDDGSSVPERVPVDVGELLDDAVTSSRAAYPDRPIELDAGISDTVAGDHDQLLRVVRNLIGNAAVHTRPGGPIRVRGFPDGAGVVMQVIDSGPGLAPEDAARVFERFWRADKARSRARGGTGLGMSIVASIVAAHGGTVRFDSAVESGSTVTVWLPRYVAAPAPPPPRRTGAPPPG